MKVGELVRRLMYVHKCASCRTILDQKHFDDALCNKCEEAYRKAKTESCPQCLRSVVECTCQPKMLSSSGALCLRKLFFYHPHSDKEVQNKLVYFLKHQPSKRVEAFVAKELLPPLREEIQTIGAEDIVIVNVPRGRKAVLENGFDQSERICRAISVAGNIPYASAIKRRFGGKEQKKLNAAERKKNIRSLMCPDMRYADMVKDRYVILFDDIVTTGASMAVCLPILRKMGAKGVICCAIATDMKKKREI